MAPSHALSKARTFVRRTAGGRSTLGAVAAGGLIGSAARIGIGEWIPVSGAGFPTGVLTVNLAGSLLLGLYLARSERAVRGRGSLQFWAIGLLGSFTTFSTFSVDVVQLLATGRPVIAVSYVVTSVIGGLTVALVGQRIGAALP